MDIFKRIKSFLGREPTNQTYTLTDPALYELFKSYGSGDAMKVATYLTCLKILAETMAKVPIKVMQESGESRIKRNDHWLNKALNQEPNPLYNAIIMRQQEMYHWLHYGNAYKWTDPQTKWQWLLHPDYVTPMITKDRRTVVYIYNDGANVLQLLPGELVHLRGPFTDEYGIKGIPLRKYLSTMLEGQESADDFQANLIKSGMTGQKLAMEFGTGVETITETELLAAIGNIEKFAKYNSGKIIPLPPLVSLKSLDLKLSDSQYFELRKLSSEQISSAFGIPPMMLNDLAKSSYSSQEMQMISFLMQTLQPYIAQYEIEHLNKLLYSTEKKKGYYLSFNTKSLLKATAKEQAEYLAALVGGMIITPNEARMHLEYNRSDNPIADELISANGSSIPVRLLGTQYQEKGGKGNEE